MTAKTAIDKIIEVLDLKFKSHKFAKSELVDGTKVTNNMDDEFRVGQELFIEKEDNVLEPAPMGTHELREGLLVTVSETGIIEAIEKKSEVSEDETEVEIERNDEMAEEEVMVSPDMVEIIVKALEPVMEEMKKLREDMKSMKEETMKKNEEMKKDFEAFKKAPERKSIVEKATLKESFSDYQMDIIRNLRNK